MNLEEMEIVYFEPVEYEYHEAKYTSFKASNTCKLEWE